MLAFSLTLLSGVLAWVERRPGVLLGDPVLAAIAPRDFTWLIFALIYAGLALGIGRLLVLPNALLAGVQAYAVLVMLRVATMMLTPLAAPAGMIALADPFAEHVVAGGPTLTKDLFFSGHTATLFLLFLSVPGRPLKALLLGFTAVVGVALLWQHVHYTIDVLAAPAFAYASVALSKLTRAREAAPPTRVADPW